MICFVKRKKKNMSLLIYFFLSQNIRQKLPFSFKLPKKINHLPASLTGLCKIMPSQDLKTLKFPHSFHHFVKHFYHQNLPIVRNIGLKLVPVSCMEDKFQLKKIYIL